MNKTTHTYRVALPNGQTLTKTTTRIFKSAWFVSFEDDRGSQWAAGFCGSDTLSQREISSWKNQAQLKNVLGMVCVVTAEPLSDNVMSSAEYSAFCKLWQAPYALSRAERTRLRKLSKKLLPPAPTTDKRR